MAIARGAGTEIIRSAHFNTVDSTTSTVIIGVQHHIYTVLSVLIYVQAIQADGNWVTMHLTGYETKAGTSAQSIYIFQQDMSLDQTYVWNDKFSFNGFEPTDFTATLDTVAKQDAIADQGSSVPQYLKLFTEHADDSFDVTVTYIDQNNA
jgi:hypothetical protein